MRLSRSWQMLRASPWLEAAVAAAQRRAHDVQCTISCTDVSRSSCRTYSLSVWQSIDGAALVSVITSDRLVINM